MAELFIPVAKVDEKGNIVCPKCQIKIPVPANRLMGRGPGQCPAGHAFIVDDDAAVKCNEIRSKLYEGRWLKDPLKRFEETPEGIGPEKTKGGIILPIPEPDEDEKR